MAKSDAWIMRRRKFSKLSPSHSVRLKILKNLDELFSFLAFGEVEEIVFGRAEIDQVKPFGLIRLRVVAKDLVQVAVI